MNLIKHKPQLKKVLISQVLRLVRINHVTTEEKKIQKKRERHGRYNEKVITQITVVLKGVKC